MDHIKNSRAHILAAQAAQTHTLACRMQQTARERVKGNHTSCICAVPTLSWHTNALWHDAARGDSCRPTAATEASAQVMSFVPNACAHLAASAQLA